MSFPKHVNTRPGTTRRVRLEGYDYSLPGYYFVTICTHNRLPYLGSISNGSMSLSSAGTMVQQTVIESATKFAATTIDSFVVMPNHIHFLIGLAVRLNDDAGASNLIDVVHWIKSTTHHRYRYGVLKNGWRPYDHHLWQEGYHDHIVRNERELETIRAYIDTNIERWGKDVFYDGFTDWG